MSYGGQYQSEEELKKEHDAEEIEARGKQISLTIDVLPVKGLVEHTVLVFNDICSYE